ncbi:MAG: hypothetical protein H7070_14700 [Saprospiraceae bacterium]|nr:hypothetical protein [Pyrinomonadaceae bacterium]
MKSLFCSIVIFLTFAGQNSFGQPPATSQRNDEVLAQGNPPLTLSLNDKLVEFFEWGLASKFTKSQRAIFTTRLLQAWEKPDQSKIDALVQMRTGYENLATAKKEERDAAQQRVQAVLLDAFPKEPTDGLAQFLLSVYKSSHPDTAAVKPTQAPVNRPGTQGGVPAELVGEWIARRGSGGSYVNPTTGQHSGPNATVKTYKIFANGTYEHGMLMQSSLYNCTTTIFAREVGPITVHGATMTITPGPGTLESKNSCSPGLNERKQTREPQATYSWRIQRGEFGLELCLVTAENTSACFLKQ